MKIFSSLQLKQLDEYTIAQEPIASIDLMERACRAFTEWFLKRFRNRCKVAVVCGTGNNGGDGLGIARMLAEYQFSVEVFIVRGEANESQEFKTNYQRIKNQLIFTEVVSISALPDFTPYQILIDALFGYGLSRPISGIYSEVIRQINNSQALRIAVDVPSGLMIDQPSMGEIVKAHRTVSFQLPKLAFLLPENHPFVGEWTLLDIGLNQAIQGKLESHNFLTTESEVKNMLRQRPRFSHKGKFGHALIIAGSKGKMGAAILSAKAAMRSGVGLLTVHVPQCGNDALQISVPEAMTSIDATEELFSAINNLDYKSIGIGPGLGKDMQTVAGFKNLLENYKRPLVVDADALNIFSENQHLISLVSPDSIFTPHPKEFERLVGTWSNDFERLEKQRDFSIKNNIIVVLKGAFSSISLPNGNVYFNPTGNPGMATGGSGDVLTGILTGLLAQGYSSAEATMLGVYLHGLAGDLAANKLDMNSMIASDLIAFLPEAFKSLQKK